MPAARILVVEDEAVTRLEIVTRLGRLGYEVAGTAVSGEDAVHKAGQARPDLVLMDITLASDLDGIEAAAAIRERFSIPVVYLTADSQPETLERAKISDPFGYLLKPFDNPDLRSTIEIALYKHQLDMRLRRSEERYRELVELLDEGILVREVDGTISYANRKMAELLGKPLEKVLGSSIFSHVDLDGAAVLQRQWRLRQEGMPGRYELTLWRADGSAVEVLVSSTPRPVEGRVSAALVAVTDISARKLAERALQEAEARYRSIFENSLVGIYRSTPEGRFVSANSALASMLGYESPAQLMEEVRSIGAQVYADEGRRAEFLRQLEEHGSVEHFESRIYGRDGDALWVSQSARLVEADGKRHIDGAAMDITARKEAESAYKATFELLGRTIDSIADLVAVADLEGNIVLANQAFAEAFGLTKDEVRSRRYQSLLGQDGPLPPVEADGGERLVKIPGLAGSFQEHASPFMDLHGNVIGSVRVVRNVTGLIKN